LDKRIVLIPNSYITFSSVGYQKIFLTFNFLEDMLYVFDLKA